MCNRKPKVNLSSCYEKRTAYATGYLLEDGSIELDTKIFTSLNCRIDGGVCAELDRLNSSLDPCKDAPRVIVALKPVKILPR